MRVILQVVNKASVTINEQIYNQIERGYLLLVGIGKDDTKENVDEMVEKIAKLRVCPDEKGKTNLDIFTYKGSILSISQFTLYADTTRGNRPDFLQAANKELAIELYELFNKKLAEKGMVVKEGIFGADMKVNLENNGPFTIFIEN